MSSISIAAMKPNNRPPATEKKSLLRAANDADNISTRKVTAIQKLDINFLADALEVLAEKSNRSQNELVSFILEYAINNSEITDQH